MYELEQKQSFPLESEKLWEFISHPKNLNTITPDRLQFRIQTQNLDKMYNGLLIKYKIKLPLLGWREWVTEIKHIEPGYAFVDEQRFGPYKFWFHYHGLTPLKDGVEMIDRVHYKLPFGIVGRIAHKLFVRPMLNQIFEFRRKKLLEMFGAPPSQS
jgi:ligand-binding SRPBCC domain-containing protein